MRRLRPERQPSASRLVRSLSKLERRALEQLNLHIEPCLATSLADELDISPGMAGRVLASLAELDLARKTYAKYPRDLPLYEIATGLRLRPRK
jgi:hypothetical protein